MRQIAVDFGEPRRTREDLGLLFRHPDDAIEAWQNIERLAGNRMNTLGPEGLTEANHLGTRALVEPGHAGPDRGPVLGERAEGLALIGDRHGGDPLGIDLIGDAAQRGRRRIPPVIRVLLGYPGCGLARPMPCASAMARPLRSQAIALVAEVEL